MQVIKKLESLTLLFVLCGLYIIVPALLISQGIDHYLATAPLQLIVIFCFFCYLRSFPSITLFSVKELLTGLLILITVVFSVATINTQLLNFLTGGYHEMAIQNNSAPSLLTSGTIFFLNALILAPVLEEIVFRYYLVSFYSRYFSKTSSILISAAAFALFHMSLASFLPLFSLGVVLSYIHKKTTNIFLCITLHSLFNFLALLYNSL